jgi:thiol-disulfide isomerase/thioredoxin
MSKRIAISRWASLLFSLAMAAGCDHAGSGGHGAHGDLLPPGTPLPALAAEGWLNGPGPTTEELRGQVVVIDVWAYWCGPCRAAMPELVSMFNKYQDRGVQFIGFTMEGADKLDDTRAVVEGENLTWPNGYGAGGIINALGVKAIPSVFVIGKDGRVVWNSDRPGSLEEAIDSALGKG